jgi:Fic family protein
MKWNWQQKDWPVFTYNNSSLATLEKEFLYQSGILIGALVHLNDEEQNQLKIDIFSNEALKTSEIEGEYLNRDSLQSSIRRYFGLNTDASKITPAEQGIADMMINLYQSFDKNLSHKTLSLWHKMLCTGRRDLHDIGKYRTHDDPMQVVSGPLHKPNIHFEAPPSKQMKYEMDNYISWFNNSKNNISPLTRASIAHLYFVSIHPFEDGNGRVGRAIVEKSLAESLGYPTLIALSVIIEGNKKSYYDALERANKNNEVTNWILYFSQKILEAQKYTLNQVRFLISKTKFFDKFNNQLNERQKRVLLRMFKEGIDGFIGGLSAKNYCAITKISSATASRDLKNLVNISALTKTGTLKHTRYYLNLKVS